MNVEAILEIALKVSAASAVSFVLVMLTGLVLLTMDLIGVFLDKAFAIVVASIVILCGLSLTIAASAWVFTS